MTKKIYITKIMEFNNYSNTKFVNIPIEISKDLMLLKDDKVLIEITKHSENLKEFKCKRCDLEFVQEILDVNYCPGCDAEGDVLEELE